MIGTSEANGVQYSVTVVLFSPWVRSAPLRQSTGGRLWRYFSVGQVMQY